MVSVDAVANNPATQIQESIPAEIQKSDNLVLDTIHVEMSEKSYQDLPFSEKDRENIETLITDMGQHSKIFLLFHSRKYYKIGDEISHVHPLKFLGVIFSNPDVSVQMRPILNDYFKRKNLIGGLVPNLQEVATRKGFEKDFKLFCKEINVPFEELKEYMDTENWKAMVYYLADR